MDGSSETIYVFNEENARSTLLSLYHYKSSNDRYECHESWLTDVIAKTKTILSDERRADYETANSNLAKLSDQKFPFVTTGKPQSGGQAGPS
jgi:hypothetical protein